MSFNMDVKYSNEENMWIFMLEGDMDIYTSDIFNEQAIKSFQEKEADLLINGKNLNYIDSTGLGVLIGILKMLQESNYKIYLTNIKPNIKKLFDITELDKLFIIRGENNE